jgi:hypothetical protein
MSTQSNSWFDLGDDKHEACLYNSQTRSATRDRPEHRTGNLLVREIENLFQGEVRSYNGPIPSDSCRVMVRVPKGPTFELVAKYAEVPKSKQRLENIFCDETVKAKIADNIPEREKVFSRPERVAPSLLSKGSSPSMTDYAGSKSSGACGSCLSHSGYTVAALTIRARKKDASLAPSTHSAQTA